MEPILATFWTNFEPLLGSILELKSAPEGDQKWDHFWDPLAPALRGPQPAFPGILREVWKGYWNWNYTLQKKGRDKILLAAYRYSRLETGQGWTLKALFSYEVSNFWSPHHTQ